MRQTSNKQLATLVLLLAAVGAAAYGLAHRQAISDWWRLEGYTPPAAVAALASDDTMTPKAQHIFYVNHPALEDKGAFNKDCASAGEHTIVLGCYHSDQNGIFILKVTNPSLNGVEQVTAAHEMLHAAYDRLPASEKARVDAMLLDYYHHGLTDQRIINNLKIYRKVEPGNVVNEMHSIFGTEVAKLPAPLEQYYSQYFTNRQQITTYASDYQAEFASRQAQVSAFDGELASINNQINQLKASVSSQQSELSQKQQQLKSEPNNTDAYNADVDAYNAAVGSYNATVQQLKDLVAEYNNIVNERNAIALQEQALSEALDSHTQTLSTQ